MYLVSFPSDKICADEEFSSKSLPKYKGDSFASAGLLSGKCKYLMLLHPKKALRSIERKCVQPDKSNTLALSASLPVITVKEPSLALYFL